MPSYLTFGVNQNGADRKNVAETAAAAVAASAAKLREKISSANLSKRAEMEGKQKQEQNE